MALVVKTPPGSVGDIRDVRSIPGSGRSLEEGMAAHSSILALQYSYTVYGYVCVYTHTHTHTHTLWNTNTAICMDGLGRHYAK